MSQEERFDDSDDSHETVLRRRGRATGEHQILRPGEVQLQIGGGFPWGRLLAVLAALAGAGGAGAVGRATAPTVAAEELAALRAEITAVRRQVGALETAQLQSSREELDGQALLWQVQLQILGCVQMPRSCPTEQIRADASVQRAAIKLREARP